MATINKWTNEEIAVLVYFVSRKADHEACCNIIGWKCHVRELRTVDGVRNKLEDVRKHNGKLLDQGRWNCDEVDRWLVDLGLPNLDALVEVDVQELQAVAAVRSHHPPHIACD